MNNLLGKLVQEYYGSRPNLETYNSPFCIFFFACSGSGKSTIRNYLVNRLDATYVCNDEVRMLLMNHAEENDSEVTLKQVVEMTVEKIFSEAKNHLVVFDNNIAQYYMHEDSYLNVAKKHNRPVFIIGLDAQEDILRQRIIERGVNVEELLEELPGQVQDYQKAKKDITPDFHTNHATQAELDGLIDHIKSTMNDSSGPQR